MICYMDTIYTMYFNNLPDEIVDYIDGYINDEWRMFTNKHYYKRTWSKKMKRNNFLTNKIPIYYLCGYNFDFSRYQYNYLGKYLNFVIRNDYNYLLDNFLTNRKYYKLIKRWYYDNNTYKTFNDYILSFNNRYKDSSKCKYVAMNHGIRTSKFKNKIKRKKKNKFK